MEIVAIVLVALLLMLPIQDYARREHVKWYLQPSTENWQAFQVKRREEFLVRLGCGDSHRSCGDILSVSPSLQVTQNGLGPD